MSPTGAEISSPGRSGLSGNITLKLNFLVLGAYVTPSWAHETFGRKIEWAMEYKDHEKSDSATVSEAHWSRGLEVHGGRIQA